MASSLVLPILVYLYLKKKSLYVYFSGFCEGMKVDVCIQSTVFN